jgi:hypothetical protein
MNLHDTLEKIRIHSEENIGEGTAESEIVKLESALGIKIPDEFRIYLKEIGYAEIHGDEIYSIYEVPDEIACNGLHWMNKDNELLQEGLIEFFSNDIDGTFYIHNDSGKVYLNGDVFADTFSEFIGKTIGTE